MKTTSGKISDEEYSRLSMNEARIYASAPAATRDRWARAMVYAQPGDHGALLAPAKRANASPSTLPDDVYEGLTSREKVDFLRMPPASRDAWARNLVRRRRALA